MTGTRKRWITVSIFLATAFAVGFGAFPFARHWATYNGIIVIGQRRADGRFEVNGTTSQDLNQILLMTLCSKSYVKHEYEKSKDINVYAAYQLISKNRVASTDIQKEVNSGANVENTMIKLPALRY